MKKLDVRIKVAKEFEVLLKQKYGHNIIIESYIDDNTEMVVMNHGNYELEKIGETFDAYIGKLLVDLFYSKSYYNVAFSYNHTLSQFGIENIEVENVKTFSMKSEYRELLSHKTSEMKNKKSYCFLDELLGVAA